MSDSNITKHLSHLTLDLDDPTFNLNLDELGQFLCSKISWYGHKCDYTIGKNIHGVNHVILFIDDTMYTHTRLTSYIDSSGQERTGHLWEPVVISFRSILNRSIHGKGLSYIPIDKN